MATFKAIIRKQKSAGPFPVYIRIIHNRKVGYIATDKVILFNLKKTDYHNGVIGYKRAKTRHSRADEAYIEMRVEPTRRLPGMETHPTQTAGRCRDKALQWSV